SGESSATTRTTNPAPKHEPCQGILRRRGACATSRRVGRRAPRQYQAAATATTGRTHGARSRSISLRLPFHVLDLSCDCASRKREQISGAQVATPIDDVQGRAVNDVPGRSPDRNV